MRATQVVEIVAGNVPKDQWLMGHIHESQGKIRG